MLEMLYTKLASAIGGFFGGSVILTYIKPKTIGEAFIRGGVSVGSGIIFASSLNKHFLGIEDNWDGQLVSGFIVGFLAYSILGMVANLLIKHENKDIIEAVQDIKKR